MKRRLLLVGVNVGLLLLFAAEAMLTLGVDVRFPIIATLGGGVLIVSAAVELMEDK